MNPEKHFDSYRASVLKDVLPGSVEFSKTIPSSDPEFPDSLFHQLNRTVTYIKDCISAGNREIYKTWVVKHQSGMAHLLQQMVTVVLGEGKPTPDQVFDLIHQRGWPWFKFSTHPCQLDMTFDMKDGPLPVKVVWVPRYDSRWKRDWTEPGTATFDAGELGLIWKTTPPAAEVIHPVILFKLKNPGSKIVEASLSDRDVGVTYHSVENMNTADEVVDWSLPLF